MTETTSAQHQPQQQLFQTWAPHPSTFQLDIQQDEAPHGVKRPPPDSLENEQRLAKRFDLLNLENNKKLYIPVTSDRTSAPIPTAPAVEATPALRSSAIPDSMQIEDTPHRMYIHDLEAELADVSSERSDPDAPIFIPDIDKHLARIPKHVLTGDEEKRKRETLAPGPDNQIVLYNVPKSLSVRDGEEDGVRKAIFEARNRARARAAVGDLNGRPSSSENEQRRHTMDVFQEVPSQPETNIDPEAMEVEEEL